MDALDSIIPRDDGETWTCGICGQTCPATVSRCPDIHDTRD